MTPPGTNAPPAAPDEVLSTLNRDGSRRWLRPRPSAGRFLTARRLVAVTLIAAFAAIPYVRVGGKPALLLDIARREFTILGTTYLPTDTLLVALGLLSVFVAIFLVTALFGRVWCGWACPQTVYLEFLFRPIERLCEGRHYRTGGRSPLSVGRRLLKYAIYLVLAMFLAHTFLAYFVGVEQLFRWVRSSPFEHPTAFAVMAATTGLMMVDFCWLREQVCTLMCPYGRLQSVLLDRDSLIISYDESRGEPRGPIRRSPPDPAETARGDCVDCHLCVVTCPTGIDIRRGLQMECVGCAQCIDACDRVMESVGRPRGLIRYTSQRALAGARASIVRPRTVIYPVLLVGLLGLLAAVAIGRSNTDLTVLRTRATPYALTTSGDVVNSISLKITNRATHARRFELEIDEALSLESAQLPVTIPAGAAVDVTVQAVIARNRFDGGRAAVTLRLVDDDGQRHERPATVLGPLFAQGEASP
ncbi:MAG: cytochrome c oxidase accessory protein CcoG [Phycisphaerales bacterium]|nr:cytochrome c oxidase accessory protein CcoG [Phycisphaerales bacterium]